MKQNLPKLLMIAIGFMLVSNGISNAQRQMEKLNRGVVAVRTDARHVFISWRVFGNDDPTTSFNLYRGTSKINYVPITGATNYIDTIAIDDTYSLGAIINGVEQPKSPTATVWPQFYKEIPLHVPVGGTTPDGVAYTYSPNDCSVGDVDGDGEYEILLKWDPSNSKDNSQSGYTGDVYIDAYKLNGTFLWRIDLGINIRAGAHYTQFMVYDLDGDGKAELVCKTAPGTKDGLGNYLTGAATGTDNAADYRNTAGYIITGPEYLTVFEGATGKELQTINYEPARGNVGDWGDNNGNRVDRFLACIAYLDGKTPSVVMCRGYYTRAYLTAYKWANGALTKQWAFDSNTPGNGGYAGQGYHNLSVGDVDGDGFDEIVYGACTIDHNGLGLYTTGLGHGDAQHLGVLDPSKPGLQSFNVHEDGPMDNGIEMHDAKTGKILWGYPSTGDVGRGMSADIDPTHPGYECWAAGFGLYDCKGNLISSTAPSSCNFGIWWDGDDLRELLDGTKLDKYGFGRLVTLYLYGTATPCNGTKSTPNIQADILGDWREEIILHSSDNSKLLIFTTTTPTTRRLFTLMHDPVYRMGVARENVAYNQPPQVGFYLGNGMGNPANPPMQQVKLSWKGDNTSNLWDVNTTANWLSKGIASVFNQNDTVMFDFSGSNAVPVSITGTVSPGYLLVNSPSNYVFNGTGALTGIMNLTKSGAGSLTFNTDQIYSGTTKVDEGALFVNGVLTQSPVSVNWHAKIGGTGNISKTVTMANGAIIVPGTDGGTGTINFASELSIADGITCNFDLSDDPTGAVKTNDQINITGNLNFHGTITIQINPLNGKLGIGTYHLINYTGTFIGDISKIAVVGVYGQKVTIDNSGGVISITVAATRNPGTITWSGIGIDWDLATSPNWLLQGAPDIFVTNDTVAFDATGVVHPNVNVTGSLPMNSMIVETANTNYSFSGTGLISGPGGITKNGNGKLSLLSKNDYTGKTIINGGTLETKYLDLAGVASSIGASSQTDPAYFILNNATLNHTGASVNTTRGLTLNGTVDTIALSTATNIITISGLITGTAKLVKTGAGTLNIKGQTNTFNGGTIIKGGTVAFGDDIGNVSGLGSGSITLDGGKLTMLSNTASASSATSAWNLIIPNGSSGSLSADGRCQLTGTLTGGGTFTFYTPYVRTALNGDWSAFTGTINVTTDADGGDFRVNNSYGYANSSINLNDKVYAYYAGTVSAGGTTIDIGELSGTAGSILQGGATANQIFTWRIGAKNTNALFNGIIKEQNTSSITALSKIGSGTWTLTNASAYTGTTSINAGTLIVNNTTGSGTGNGAVSVNSGGTLAGTGSLAGAVTVNNGGSIAPGNANLDTLFVNNKVTFLPGSDYNIEINKTASPTTDMLLTTGAVILDGTLNITNLGTSLTTGDNFKIINSASGISGSFSNIIPAEPGVNKKWDLSALNTDGILRVSDYLPQTLTLNFTDKQYGDADFSAVASVSSGLPLTYLTDNPQVATISANGTIHIVGAGSCAIAVNQIGDATHRPATVSQILNVGKAALNVTAADTTRYVGKPNPEFRLIYSGFARDDNVNSLSTLPTPLCSANFASPTGDYEITVSGGDANNYSFAFTSGKLTVQVNTLVQTQSYSDLNLYPNPTSGWVYIDLPENTVDAIVEVFNSSGMKIKSAKESGRKISIDLTNHPSGIYMIRIIAGKNMVSRIVLKN